jgi:2-oxoglutarate ferredoxin oxidoreductase subunit beta
MSHPVAVGIIRSFEDLTFEEREMELTKEVRKKSKFTKVDELFFSGDTYEVK